ncbi:hypothetical protein [Clostridium sp.]|uniref:hypothetical protein n=1 Tax=Clostridium sp. TaxID=1506 RepID=UPI0026016CB7|nr:hypothetical protein [Clostridium sp.]
MQTNFFYEDFNVKVILTKAIPIANERIKAVNTMGYKPINKKNMVYDDYYLREI